MPGVVAYIDKMRSSRFRPLWSGTLVFAAGLATVTSCSSGHDGGKAPASSASPSGLLSQAALPPTGPPPPGAVGVSPGGITTKVDVPADSSEEQYGQACHAAKVWMDHHGGDPQSLIEPYLAKLQAPGAAPGNGTFNKPWAQLTPGQQAAAIVAVRAAADNQCG
jgi:hypothetical protein